MRAFKSQGWYKVKERQCVAVKLDREEVRDGLLERLQAEGVTVDGVPYEIDGVESYALGTLREGSPIGLRIDLNTESSTGT